MATGLQLPQTPLSPREPDTHRICRENEHGQIGSLTPTIETQGLLNLDYIQGLGQTIEGISFLCTPRITAPNTRFAIADELQTDVAKIGHVLYASLR